MKSAFRLILVAAAVGFAAYYYIARPFGPGKTVDVEFDRIVDVVQNNRNRLEVSTLAGKVQTTAETRGGIGGVLRGKIVVKQPFSVGYFVNMADLNLDDYAWNPKTKVLLVRAPQTSIDPPNVDESRQEVRYEGALITRDMQTRLRAAVAVGAKKQVVEEASTPQHMDEAARAARDAIQRNLEQPLWAAGVRGVEVELVLPRERESERWDVSSSIAEVLRRRAAEGR